MRCKQCGHPLSRKQGYCGKCGAPIPKRRKWPVVVGAVAVLLLAIVGFFAYRYFSTKNMLDTWESDDYVYEFDEQVLQVVDAKASEAVPTVAELVPELKERGFGEAEVFAPYDLEGQLLEDEQSLDHASQEKYPLYYIPYTDANGNDWVIYSNNGEYEANPLFAYDQLQGEVIIVESDHLVSYDGSTNTFIESLPAEHEVRLKRVSRIDAATLSQIKSAEDIEAL